MQFSNWLLDSVSKKKKSNLTMKSSDLLSNKVNCGKNWVISRRMTGIRILVSVKFTKVGESI